jgi:LCP family protein required for cell wall assembly
MNHAIEQHPDRARRYLTALIATRRRRATVATILVLGIIAVILGIQSWRVINTIVEVEKAAVVPLPPSDTALLTPTAEPPALAELNPSFGGIVADVEPPVTEESTVEESTDRGQASIAGQARTPQATPESKDREESGGPSRLDVARELVEASIGNGDPGKSEIWSGREGLNILVLGVDRRPDGGDQNADVIIIAHLDLVRQRLSGVSLPRDLLVEIPGIGPDKVNGAYNYGVLEYPDDPVAGVAKVRDTIEAVFGVPVDGYVLVDFEGFTKLIDALGGVEVDVPYDIVDDAYPTIDYGVETVRFDAGVQELNGEEALKYVRTRHADSDDARRERQLDLIKAIFSKGRSISSITNADDIILAAGDAVQTSFDLEEQLTLARLAFAMSPEDIHLSTLGEPILQPGWTDEGRWVYTGDSDQIKRFVLDALDTTKELEDTGPVAG